MSTFLTEQYIAEEERFSLELVSSHSTWPFPQAKRVGNLSLKKMGRIPDKPE